MACDDDAYPGQANDDQRNCRPTQRGGINGAREQALTIERGVDAEGEEARGEDAEDDAANNTAAARDQSQSRDGSSCDREGNRASEAAGAGASLIQYAGRSSPGSRQLHVAFSACFGINIPYAQPWNGNPLHNTCPTGSICVVR